MTATKIPCINDAEYKAAAQKQADAIQNEALVWTAIQVAMLAARMFINKGTTDLRYQLANRRMKMAEEAVKHAMETWPYEKDLVNDTFNEAKHSPLYGSEIAMVDSSSRKATKSTNKLLTDSAIKLGGSVTHCMLHRSYAAFATIKTDTVAYIMRAAEARALALNDRRASRQLSVLALGRGRVQSALAMGQLGAYQTQIGDTLIGSINSAMQLWGYQDTRWKSSGNWATQLSDIPHVVPVGQTSYTVPSRDPAPAIVVNNYLSPEALGQLSPEE